MYDNSRIGIYNYLYNMFFHVVTDNVYPMFKPLELTTSDTSDGFLVIKLGSLNDESEFHCNAYGWARCYVTAYVPLMSRGRVDMEAFSAYESSINGIVNDELERSNAEYGIIEETIISYDDIDDENPNNQFATFTKSFVVTMDGDNNN